MFPFPNPLAFLKKDKTSSSNHTPKAAAQKPVFEFDNPHTGDAMKAIDGIINVGLGCSTLTSAVSFGQSTILILKPYVWAGFYDKANYYLYYPYVGLCFFIAFYICGLIDFYGIRLILRLAVAELVAYVSGYFRFGLLRKIQMLLWSIVGVAFFSISFITSYKGVEAVKIASIDEDPTAFIKELNDIESNQNQNQNNAVALYDAQINELKQQLPQRLAVATSRFEQDLAANSEWAAKEAAKAKNKVQSEYDKKVADLMQKRDAALTKANDATKETSALKTSLIKKKMDTNERKGDVIFLVGQMTGTLPLVIAAVLICIAVMSGVVEAINKVERKQGGN